MSALTPLRQRLRSLKVTLVLSLACMSLLGGWMAWLAGGAYIRHTQQQSLQAALPPLSREVDQALSDLESRLVIGSARELTNRSNLEVLLQDVRMEFAFVHALQFRNNEGMLLQTTSSSNNASELYLSPGHAALFELAIHSGRAGYSGIYKEHTRGPDSHWVDLFSPMTKGDRQGLVVKISVQELLRSARDNLDRNSIAGLDLAILETLHANPLQTQKTNWIASNWPMERHGLKMTLVGEVSSAQSNSTSAMQLLLSALGGISMLFVSLWVRGLRLRQVTKQRLSQLEAQMQSDARVATLGEMSTAIAHELNQPLGAIANYAYAAEKLAKQYNDSTLMQGLAQIRNEAQRGAEVIKSIRSFVRREESASQLVDITEMMQDLRPLLELQAHSQGCRLSIDVQQGLHVNCSKALLQQVLLNLAKNGIEAMRDVPKANRILRIHASFSPETQRVCFSVVDVGHGISEQVRQSLFKPFFTTKKDGLGIGLSLCLSIAERQGGTMSWQNNQDVGASFKLELPLQGFAKGMP